MGQLPQRAGSLGLTAVGLPPRYPQPKTTDVGQHRQPSDKRQKMVNSSRYYRALESKRQHSISFAYRFYHLPKPDPSPLSPSTLIVTPTSYSSEKGVAAGHSGQFTPGGYLSTMIHTTLVGLEPTTFRLLVRRSA